MRVFSRPQAVSLSKYSASSLCRSSFVWFVTEFPMTVTGKLQKFRMREIAIEKMGLTEAPARPAKPAKRGKAEAGAT
jgi:hypothetical protein